MSVNFNAKRYSKLIKDFFNSHAMIMTVKIGNQFNFNADSHIIYRVAHIEFIDERGGVNGFKTHNFLITIADLFDPNAEESEFEIYSDTFEIADDCIAHFGNLIDYSFTINESIQVSKFNNGHTDKVCGAQFTLSFTDDPQINDCTTPFKQL